MIADDERADSATPAPACVAVSVGNTRTQVGIAQGSETRDAASLANDDAEAIAAALAKRAQALETKSEPAVIVIASVNEAAAERIVQADRASDAAALKRARLLQLGVDLPIPIRHTLGPEHTTGRDRFLAALAAHRLLGQACVVVDAGTAITVDFVDGEGVFHGGAIAPGLALGLDALRARTAALPGVELQRPDLAEAFPKTTRQAMLAGVFFAAVGLVRALTERYAERFGAYPKVIATGGDAQLLFGDDPLVDRVAPSLVLAGVGISFAAAEGADAAAPGASRDDDDAEPHAGLSAL